eukprot:TRINITY_DN449_c1_g1_i1.p1 TRINITY_DN449_c1_g1~~TRINITY_DN449_c1_g1_i1.p1  ORF type:complete len:514 (+),score=97.13 TRINITY_DN449_c1_g1_i1:62-1603(+)
MIIVLILIIPGLVVTEGKQSNTYKAAVVEYAPHLPPYNVTERSEALRVMMSNMDEYEIFLRNSSTQNVDIIVFPEDGLYGPNFQTKQSILPFLEPIPDTVVNPCDTWNGEKQAISPITYRASCLAFKYGIALVMNMGDIVPCVDNSTCPPEGHFQFNTQVAFDKNGTFLAKYHKEHLYYETQFDVPVNQSLITFYVSSIDVTFGMSICYDMMFGIPMLRTAETGVRDFVYSSWWVNTPPVLSGTSLQRAWSLTTQSNLLAAGSGQSSFNSGSGIYSSGSVIASYSSNQLLKPESKLLIGDVTIITTTTETTTRRSDRSKMKHFKIADSKKSINPLASSSSSTATTTTKSSNYTINMKKLDTTVDGVERNVTVSLPNVSCSLNYMIENTLNASTQYVLLAIDGYYWPGVYITTCGLYMCPTPETCGNTTSFPMNSTTTFGTKLTLDVSFNSNLKLINFFIGIKDTGELFSDWMLLSNPSLYDYHLSTNYTTRLITFSVMGRPIGNIFNEPKLVL